MSDEQWQVAGSAAEIYDKFLVPAVFGQWAPLLLDSVSLKPGMSVLDVACGSGLVARTAGPCVTPGGKVVGLDLNLGMIAVAKKSMEPLGVVSEWYEASATEMPLDDCKFDVVFCQLGLQFFPDKATALSEICRVLIPGGIFSALVWRGIENSPGFKALASALQKYVSADAAAIMRAPFVFGDGMDGLRDLLSEAGFSDIRITFDTRMCRFPSVAALFDSYSAGSPIAPHVANLDSETRGAITSELAQDLRVWCDDSGLSFPIQGHIVTARK